MSYAIVGVVAFLLGIVVGASTQKAKDYEEIYGLGKKLVADGVQLVKAAPKEVFDGTTN